MHHEGRSTTIARSSHLEVFTFAFSPQEIKASINFEVQAAQSVFPLYRHRNQAMGE